jgi:hypothetical protein
MSICLLSRTLVLAIAIASSALAQEEIVAGTSNGVPYASGGIGLESRQTLQGKQSGYNLMVILSRKDGHFLGGAAVSIRNLEGKTVFDIDAKGPWIFAKLPPGSYTVEATVRNVTRKEQVVIGKTDLKRVYLIWA